MQVGDGIRDHCVTGVQTCALPIYEYRIMGLKTNLPFHQQLMHSHHFISGKFDTGYVDHYYNPNSERRTEANLKTAAILATLVAHQEGQIGRASCRERV